MFERIVLTILLSPAAAVADTWYFEGVLIRSDRGLNLLINPGTPLMNGVTVREARSSAKHLSLYESGTLVRACFTGTDRPSVLVAIEPLEPSLNAAIVEEFDKQKRTICPF